MLKQIYDQMWQEAVHKFTNGDATTDPLIEDPRDRRRGITLILRPHGKALEGLEDVQSRLKSVVGMQYFPLREALHVTGLSLITCVNDFRLEDIDVERYADVVEDALRQTPAFKLSFMGITASPSCIMAQGFVDSDVLARARKSIQENIDVAGLRHTIGQRYPPRTAHCTLLRFKTRPLSTSTLVEELAELREAPIGDCQIHEAILVYNDWYHNSSVVQELRKIPLAS